MSVFNNTVCIEHEKRITQNESRINNLEKLLWYDVILTACVFVTVFAGNNFVITLVKSVLRVG